MLSWQKVADAAKGETRLGLIVGETLAKLSPEGRFLFVA
jgi:hypothetical protein